MDLKDIMLNKIKLVINDKYCTIPLIYMDCLKQSTSEKQEAERRQGLEGGQWREAAGQWARVPVMLGFAAQVSACGWQDCAVHMETAGSRMLYFATDKYSPVHKQNENYKNTFKQLSVK